MRSLVTAFMLLWHIACVVAPVSAAGHDEVARMLDQWMEAWRSGDAATLGSLYAEDASYTSALVPFRIEGREAIQGSWAGAFQTFPTRVGNLRQVATRVYSNGAVAAQNG